MSGFYSIRRLTAAAILMTAALGCSKIVAAEAEVGGSVAPTSAPATPPNPSLAFINGKEVNRDAFNAIMMQVAGMRVFQQVYDLTIVQNACVISGVTMTGKEYTDRIQAEIDKALDSMAVTPVAGAPALSKEEDRKQREAMLGQVLARQGVTAIEFRIGIETRAGLRALAKGKTVTTDADVDAAYLAQNGERRSVHILVLPDDPAVSAKMSDSYKSLITASKKTPEEAAAELKLGAPANWTISKNADNIESIRKAAFDLAKPGDFSAITTVKGQGGGPDQKVVILLDKIEADKTATNPKTPAVMNDLRQKVSDQKESIWMNNQLQVLRGNATVDIKDPVLSEQFSQVAAGLRAQAAAAAGAPAGATGTAPATAPASLPAPATSRPAGLPAIGPASAPAR